MSMEQSNNNNNNNIIVSNNNVVMTPVTNHSMLNDSNNNSLSNLLSTSLSHYITTTPLNNNNLLQTCTANLSPATAILTRSNEGLISAVDVTNYTTTSASRPQFVSRPFNIEIPADIKTLGLTLPNLSGDTATLLNNAANAPAALKNLVEPLPPSALQGFIKVKYFFFIILEALDVLSNSYEKIND